jgi:hypothetical protein
MALIECPECSREISDKAAACPHCGNPLHIDTGEGTQLTTTQQTSKTIKTEILISIGLFVVGIAVMYVGDLMVAGYPELHQYMVMGGLLMVALGIGGYIHSKLKQWWHHA